MFGEMSTLVENGYRSVDNFLINVKRGHAEKELRGSKIKDFFLQNGES